MQKKKKSIYIYKSWVAIIKKNNILTCLCPSTATSCQIQPHTHIHTACLRAHCTDLFNAYIPQERWWHTYKKPQEVENILMTKVNQWSRKLACYVRSFFIYKGRRGLDFKQHEEGGNYQFHRFSLPWGGGEGGGLWALVKSSLSQSSSFLPANC